MARRSDPVRPQPDDGKAPDGTTKSLREQVIGTAEKIPKSSDDWAAMLSAAVPLLGGPLPPSTPLTPGEPLPGLWDVLTWLARREGFTVSRWDCDGAAGRTRWTTRHITISKDLDDPAADLALTHELGHVLMHRAPWLAEDITTAGCRGTRKVEADSAAFIVASWLGLGTASFSWPYPTTWAGTDPRAQPEAAIQTAAHHIFQAATTIVGHLSIMLFTTPPALAPTRPETATPTRQLAEIRQALNAAEAFYLRSLERSWAPTYLAKRGITTRTAKQWRIGYTPARWTALTDHLRAAGHSDDTIEAAGLARRSSRGTLIDYFRDRVMLAIRDEHGKIAGFIGRANPSSKPTVPKYLNTPDTAAFTKGDLLFGLHEARDRLTAGALPVLVEGPFDAIAVTAADPARFTGIAPCGTALTSRQADALARAVNLADRPVLLALDGDRAGRDAALRAHDVLSAVTTNAAAAILPANRDPAEILQADGPAALTAILSRARPLATLVIDAHLDQWAPQLRFAEGQVAAMRSAAELIARTIPPKIQNAILRKKALRPLVTVDDELRPIACPELPQIARLLPATTASQIALVAERLGVDYSDVTAEVANHITIENPGPKGPAPPTAVDFPKPPLPASSPQPARRRQLKYPSQRRSRTSARR